MPDPPAPQPPPPQTLREAAPYYPRILGFGVLNAVNFHIALTTPLILLARHWGASALYIGLLAALQPLLGTLQLWMAPRVEYLGLGRVMFMGWSARNAFLGVVLLLILASALGLASHPLLLAGLFLTMFAFNTLRGLATASWMPWITKLVEPGWRGRYMSAEQTACNTAAVLAFLFCGLVLGNTPSDTRFGLLYLTAFLAGWGSLFFLRSVPAPEPLPGRPVIEPIWIWARRVWGDRPFRRLIRMNVAVGFGYAAWLPFTVVFLRDHLGIADRDIMFLTACNMVGALGTSWLWGALADRFNSRPVLALATRLLLLDLLCWMLIAAGLLPGALAVLVVLFLLMGSGWCGFTVANNRFSLNNAPAAFPVLALTLFSVALSVAQGLAPPFWGVALDHLHGLHATVGLIQFNPFVIFFAGAAATIVVAKLFVRRLPECDAPETHVVLYHMLTDYPLRTAQALYRALQTLPRPRG